MNKISLYLLLILIYLGLSKSLSPHEKKIPYISNEKDFQIYFPQGSLSVILEGHFQTGFLIKTHFIRIRVIYSYLSSKSLLMRTSPKYWEKISPYEGLSLFRRSDDLEKIEYGPMPPGTLFIDDPNYGHWKNLPSGIKIWVFEGRYRRIPKILNWDQYFPKGSPSKEFFHRIKNEPGLVLSFAKKIQEDKNKLIIPTIQKKKDERLKKFFKKLLRVPPFHKKEKSE